MPEKKTTRRSSHLNTSLLQSAQETSALEQMYQQSRFEAQCWFFSSLITAIIGTSIILGTMLLFLFLRNTEQLSDGSKITLILTNVINGGVQHLIIAQARSANRRTDQYARELNREDNELHIHEILRFIVDTLPENEERNALLIQTVMHSLSQQEQEGQSPLPISTLRQQKQSKKNNPEQP